MAVKDTVSRRYSLVNHIEDAINCACGFVRHLSSFSRSASISADLQDRAKLIDGQPKNCLLID
jgi:hypothetical protein